MSKRVTVLSYNDACAEQWDAFVSRKSINGTFLQTRRFIAYHDNAFADASLMFMNGNEIVAVIPAHIRDEDGRRVLYAHEGSTFGGLIVGADFYNITYLDLIMERLDEYLQLNNIDSVFLRQPGSIFVSVDTTLLEYYFFLFGYQEIKELGYYVDLDRCSDDILAGFSSSRRRDYRYSLKNNYTFCCIESEEGIIGFHTVLSDNYTKFGKKPIHSVENLIDFKYHRLKEETLFFGVYYQGRLIAGCMAFCFGKRVFHTQYLAVMQEYKDMFVNEFMYKNLLEWARSAGFRYFSFGTATLDHGSTLNRNLARFKEGFGTLNYVNRTYKKVIVTAQKENLCAKY